MKKKEEEERGKSIVGEEKQRGGNRRGSPVLGRGVENREQLLLRYVTSCSCSSSWCGLKKHLGPSHCLVPKGGKKAYWPGQNKVR